MRTDALFAIMPLMLGILLCRAMPCDAAGGSRRSAAIDSLAYVVARDALLADDSLADACADYLDAAAKLAAEGFFTEAYAVIEDLGHEGFGDIGDEAVEELRGDTAIQALLDEIEHGTDEPRRAPALPDGTLPPDRRGDRPAPSHTWRLTTGASYERFADGLDPADSLLYDSPSSGDSLVIFTDEISPLTGRVRIATRLDNLHALLTALEPSVYLSNSRLQGGVTMEGDFVRDVVSYSIMAAARKRLYERYRDSSDALTGALSLMPSTERWSRRVWFSAPLEVAAERYRHDRPGYANLTEWALKPSLNVAPGDAGGLIQLQWCYEAIRFGAAYQDENSVETGPRLNVDLWLKHLSTMISLGAIREKYPHAEAPSRRDRLSGMLDLRLTPHPRLELALTGTLGAEREHYPDQLLSYETTGIVPDMVYDTVTGTFSADVDTIISYRDTTVTYDLGGVSVQLKPSVRFALARCWYVQPELGFERLHYPSLTHIGGQSLSFPVSLWESSVAWEPMLRLGWAGDRLSWEFGGGYRRENVIDETYTADSREAIAGVEGSWQFVPWARIDLMSTGHYRLFDGGGRETDLYVNLSVTMVFRP